MRGSSNGRSSERGVALVLAMIMVLIVSMLGASLITLGRGETLSSLNYRSMSQARYGAEAGLHSSINYLLNGYTPPATLAGFTITTDYPYVAVGNQPVVLTTVPGEAYNYPSSAVQSMFTQQGTGQLSASNGSMNYYARATLVSMRQFNDAYSGLPALLQTWDITGVGSVAGAGSAAVEVTTRLERQAVPAFRFAAFATSPGCAALTFGGGATTNSYDSSDLAGGFAATGGNVGTNGNLTESGATTTINGTLSTPRSGVGNCTAANVTAETLVGGATVSEGLVQLPQPITLPTPAAITPAPPTTSDSVNGSASCPGAVPYCTENAGAVLTFSPPTPTTVVSAGNLSVSAGVVVHLNAGIYEVNSINISGNAQIVVDSGPVIFRVAGAGFNDNQYPIDFLGGSISNPSLDPQNLQFVYGGTARVRMSGGTDASALIYAPNAEASITGGAHFYGSVVANKVTDMGGAAIHYDRRLQRTALTSGNPTVTTFSWNTF